MDTISPSDYPSKTVTYTGTAGTTAAINPARAVLVWTTTDAYVKVGESVTATSSDTPIPAYTPVLFEVPRGSNAPFVVSAIQISAGGSVYAKSVGGALA